MERVAVSSCRGSSGPRDWARTSGASCVGRRILYHWATQEASSLPDSCPEHARDRAARRAPAHGMWPSSGHGRACGLHAGKRSACRVGTVGDLSGDLLPVRTSCDLTRHCSLLDFQLRADCICPFTASSPMPSAWHSGQTHVCWKPQWIHDLLNSAPCSGATPSRRVSAGSSPTVCSPWQAW